MRPIEEVYPDRQNGDYFYNPSDYQPMLESLGYEIIAQEDDGDYQGDSYLLLRNGGQYGYLTFGWGSCSGCDALQGCDSYKEIDELRTQLHEQIIWKPSKAEMREWLLSKDWHGEWSFSEPGFHRFFDKVLGVLEV